MSANALQPAPLPDALPACLPRAVSLFCCYSHKDEELQDELETHLSTLRKSGAIKSWNYRQIIGGQEWRKEIEAHLNEAEIILLLLSANFFASEYCYEFEAQRALERHAAGQARVIPILLTAAADWLSTPIGKLQALPPGAQPITTWPDRDKAWADVVEGIKEVVAELVARPAPVPEARPGPFLIPNLKGLASVPRLAVLEALRQGFCEQNGPPSIQCLYGLRGMGKTHTAIAYASRYRNHYRAAFLIGADGEMALREGFFEIAQVLGLPLKDPQSLDEGVRVTLRWLTENPGWLLILAKAISPETVRSFIPFGSAGHVLITADHDFRELGVDRALPLTELTPSEALSFLRERTGYKLQNQEKLAAAELARELGFLPLALEQAAAFIRQRQMPVSVHLRSLRQRPAEILGKYRTSLGPYRESVAKTWDLIFAKLEEESPPAADFLHLSSLLNGDRISMDLLYREGEVLKPVMAELGPTIAAVGHADQLFELLAPLASYSLIQMEPDSGWFSINRLLQQAVRLRMDEATHRLWAERAVRAVAKAIAGLRYEDWPRHQYLSPQVTSAAELIEAWNFSFPEAAMLLNKAGQFLHEQSRYDLAEKRYRVAHGICEKTVGSRSIEIADSLNGLGRVCSRSGRYRDAEGFFVQALAIRHELLGDEHEGVAAIENNLALLRFHMEPQNEEIEDLYQHSLRVRQARLGADHPLVARTLKNLGLMHTFRGRYHEAEVLHRRALAMFQRTLGHEHPMLAQCFNGLGGLYLKCADLTAAERYYQQGRKICDEAQGTEHPDAAYSISGLARVYALQGKDCEAEALFLEALRLRETHLGAEHPEVATCLFGLAALRDRAGNFADAELLYQRVLRIWGRALATTHPDLSDCREQLASLLSRLGQRRSPPDASHDGIPPPR